MTIVVVDSFSALFDHVVVIFIVIIVFIIFIVVIIFIIVIIMIMIWPFSCIWSVLAANFLCFNRGILYQYWTRAGEYRINSISSLYPSKKTCVQKLKKIQIQILYQYWTRAGEYRLRFSPQACILLYKLRTKTKQNTDRNILSVLDEGSRIQNKFHLKLVSL